MYVIALVTFIQIIVYKEVIALASVPATQKKIPFFKVLNWYLIVEAVGNRNIGTFWQRPCSFCMERV